MGAGGILAAQGQPQRQDSVPRAYLPPAKMCRVWIDGVPAAQQPAPTDCPTAIQKKPANGRVIYGDDKGKASSQPMPVNKFTAPGEKKAPPSRFRRICPQMDPLFAREQHESKRITDAQLHGDLPANAPASSFPGGMASQQGPLGSYGGYVTQGGVVVGQGTLNDPRYFVTTTWAAPAGDRIDHVSRP